MTNNLHLHLGQRVRTPVGDGLSLAVDIEGQCDVMLDDRTKSPPWFHPSLVTPIVRPLSSMTDEELRPIGMHLAGYSTSDSIDKTTEFPLHVWLYLISKGFNVGQFDNFVEEDV